MNKPFTIATAIKIQQDQLPMNKPFTIATAIKIQQDQLRDWAPKLSGPCLLALQREVKKRNKAIHAKRDATGFDVFRGSDLHDFIANWKPK